MAKGTRAWLYYWPFDLLLLQVKDQFAENELFKTMDKLDCLTVFSDHMRDLDMKEEDEMRVDREKQKRESRKARDAFRVSHQSIISH